MHPDYNWIRQGVSVLVTCHDEVGSVADRGIHLTDAKGIVGEILIKTHGSVEVDFLYTYRGRRTLLFLPEYLRPYYPREWKHVDYWHWYRNNLRDDPWNQTEEARKNVCWRTGRCPIK